MTYSVKNKNGKQPTYNKAFYIGEQDFYIPKDKDGNYKRYDIAPLSFDDDKEVMSYAEETVQLNLVN